MQAVRIDFMGEVVGIQPRIRLTRSFDQTTHAYLGYALLLTGQVGGEKGAFLVGVGVKTQAQRAFRSGDRIAGQCLPVVHPDCESVQFQRASKLRLLERAEEDTGEGPPWRGLPPPLDEYRRRGHRRLAARTYTDRCQGCIWGCRMAVDIIIDHWNPHRREYRLETFCYGPKSCRLYRPGPTRKVKGRRGMVWEEADWVDEEATAHRDDDE
jgi:hypothetical protein